MIKSTYRHPFLSIVLASLLLAMMQSCRVAPQNGSFDAQWRLDKIVAADGSETPTPQYVYFCFWRHTCNINNTAGGSAAGNIVYVEDESVTIDLPHLTSTDQLAQLCLPTDAPAGAGGKGYTIKFNIDKLTSKKLVMTAEIDGATYYFTKF